MTSIQERNLLQLRQEYFERTSARKAARRIDGARTPRQLQSLALLLRHHDQSPISDHETWLRDEVDVLIHFYSLIEIASLLDLVPDPLPRDFRVMAGRHLRQPSVNRYFVNNYPLVLPQLFSLRTNGFLNLKATNTGQPFSWLVQLLHLDAIVYGDDSSVDIFLWFLDGGGHSFDGIDYDLDDVVRRYKSQASFTRSLTKKSDQMTLADSALRGSVLFFGFCRELDRLLGSQEIPPLLRYEIWHLYGYWFGAMRTRTDSDLKVLIDRSSTWSARSTARGKDRKRYSLELRAALHRLFSGEYGQLPEASRPTNFETVKATRIHSEEAELR